MRYEQWRDELFGHSPDSDFYSQEFSDEFWSVPSEQAFDFIDRALVDPGLHSLFVKDQLGNGLHTIYSNCRSNFPYLYTIECDEERRIIGIRNLIHLYHNFFDRYCTGPVEWIGGGGTDGRIGYVCYMFWDIFVLWPGNATPAAASAALDIMHTTLNSKNDNCLASAIHGLGHWALDLPEAATILRNWLNQPTTQNPAILRYAEDATTGMIQ